jgi:AraC-like DNA-binding protein
MQRIHIRDGMDLFIADYSVRAQFSFDVICPGPTFGFGFCLSGPILGRLGDTRHGVVTRQGESPLFYFPSHTGQVTYPKDTHCLSISLILSPEIAYDLLRHEFDDMPSRLRQIVTHGGSFEYHSNMDINRDIQHVAHQLINPPWSTASSRIYYESKALEIIALRLHARDGAPSISAGKKPDSRENIYHAAEILLEAMDDPPGLFSLAKAVGLSHVRLNRGFREHFGTTVFGYLRQKRLEKAKHLIETHSMNVTEAAFDVGYSSLSTFSRAFYSQYGVTPSSCGKKTVARPEQPPAQSVVHSGQCGLPTSVF